MEGCELGIKLALIEGTKISRMAPVNAMVIKIFLMMDSIGSYANYRLCKKGYAKIMPDRWQKNGTLY
jgi:hypothetical protein